MQRTTSHMLITLTTLCTTIGMAGCTINIGGWRSSQEKATRQDTLASPLAPGQTVWVQTDFGSITVTGGDTEDCLVTADITAQAPSEQEAREILDQVKIVLEPGSEGLHISVDKPKLGNNRSVGVAFTLQVPRQTSLDCRTSFGSITARQVQGRIKANTSFAGITCDRTDGPLDLHTSHGTITCEAVQAQTIRADSSFGNVRVDYAEQDTRVDQESVDLSTSHGSVTCNGASARQIEIKTSFGSIHARCAQAAPADLTAQATTSHGSIQFTAPAGFTGDVDLSTSHGKIHTDRAILVQGSLSPERIRGTIGQGQGRITLRTQFGGINLK